MASTAYIKNAIKTSLSLMSILLPVLYLYLYSCTCNCKYKHLWQTLQIKNGLSKVCFRNFFTHSDLNFPVWLFFEQNLLWIFMILCFCLYFFLVFLVFSLFFSFKVMLNIWNVFHGSNNSNKMNLEVSRNRFLFKIHFPEIFINI